MKKRIISISSIILIMSIIFLLFSGCKTNNNGLVKVRLNEVTRSVFYAPMYVAINEGFFKAEGLDIDLSTGQGADKTMQEVISKSADIGFCGPEQVIYVYNQKRDDFPIIFAQLTQRDGSFLVGRKEQNDFKWEDLRGKNVIGGRPGGVPEMALEYVLKNHGLQPGKDINLITNIAFEATAGAFKGGTGDYAALFEPTASMLKKDNSGYLIASVGASAGSIPYTCFFATKSYVDKNQTVVEKFTRAIYKGQLWINGKSEAEIAKSIKTFFPGTDETLISDVVKNYKAINAFAPNPLLKEEDLSRLMDIIQSYKSELIKERPAFDKIVTNEFGKKAMESIK